MVSTEDDPLRLDVGIAGAGSMLVSMTAVQPTRVEDASLLRKIGHAVADALGLARNASGKRQAQEPEAASTRERILILAETETAARQVKMIMARVPRFEPIIRPAMSLSKPENIPKIVDALICGNVTACILALPRPDGVRTEIREGWVNLVRSVAPGSRCEIRSIDADDHLRRCDPAWASGALQIDEPLSEETRAPPDCDPEDPTPGG